MKGFLLTSVNLPCGVLPEAVQCSLTRPANSIKKREVRVFLPVDRREWDSGPDPGSKQWLLAKALQNDDGVISGEHNPYSESSQGRSSSSVSAGSVASSVPATAADDDEVLPEDKFHIRLPANVDKYTGLPLDTPKNANHGSSAPPAVVESDELAEDRFHKSDAGSSYIISQREQAVKDKWDKHARFHSQFNSILYSIRASIAVEIRRNGRMTTMLNTLTLRISSENSNSFQFAFNFRKQTRRKVWPEGCSGSLHHYWGDDK